MDLKQKIKEIKLFLFDMDGTIYLDETPIDGALELIALLQQKQIPYVFLTNNSSKNKAVCLEKLHRLGFAATEENIYTSGEATCAYLLQNAPNGVFYLVGTDALKESFAAAGLTVCNTPDDSVTHLVVGYDTTLTYQKLVDACALLRRDLPFIATHPDWVCPIGPGASLPDCGLFCQMLTTTTGKEPIFIGKPKPQMIQTLLEKYQMHQADCLMVGDRLYTDVAAGQNAGVQTACVLSGEATIKDVEAWSPRPDFVLGSVADLLAALQEQ